MDTKMNSRKKAPPPPNETRRLKSLASFKRRMEEGVVHGPPSVFSGQVYG